MAVAGLIFLEDFGTPFVPGETILIAAALYAGTGRLNVVVVGILAVLAAVVGDNLGYAIGYFAGREAVVRWGRYVMLTPARMERVEAFFARRGARIVVIARFIDGLRQANGIVAGITEMPWTTFLVYNALGAVLWVGCWVTVGYVAGDHITSIYRWFERFAIYALIVIGAALAGLIARHFARRHKSSGTKPPSPRRH